MRLGIPLINGASLEGLTKSVVAIFTRLDNGLRRITFDENFESFEVELEIAANSIQRVANRLGRDGIVPRYFLVLDTRDRGVLIRDGDWDTTNLWLRNISSTSSFVGAVRFFR
jgi:hypothetical protein